MDDENRIERRMDENGEKDEKGKMKEKGHKKRDERLSRNKL